MLPTMGWVLIGYLAAAGLATTVAVVGRGLVGSARLAAQGQFAEAGTQALAAVAAPAVMVQASALDLIGEVIDSARELSGQVLEATRTALHSDEAA